MVRQLSAILTGMSLKSVAVLLQEPVALFEYGVLAEVFGIDRTDEGRAGLRLPGVC